MVAIFEVPSNYSFEQYRLASFLSVLISKVLL